MGKRNLQQRDDDGGSLVDKLLEAADRSLTYKGKDEGPVSKFLRDRNERHGKGWLALAFEADGSKDPEYITRIVGEYIKVILSLSHLL